MKDINIAEDTSLTAIEVVQLRKASNWDGDEQEWQACLKQNLINISARDAAGKLIGAGFLSGTVRHAQVVDLVVHPDYREHGIGEKILNQLIDMARQRHVKYLGLTYDPHTPWLRSFYEKHGFKSIDFAMWYQDSLPS